MTTLVRFQPRRKTAAAWTSSNEILLEGEVGYETDTKKSKRGDGATAWAALTYQVTSKADVGLGNVDNTSDAGKPLSTAATTALAAKADLVGGVIPTAQIPALALVTSVPAASQAAMLALTTSQVQPGDLAVRTDGAGTFMLVGTDPSVLANWRLLNAPTDAVSSVNGQTGTVVLGAADVGAAAKASNLSDLANAATARTNLGLGSAATQASSAFDAAGAATTAQGASLQKTSNLTDLASASAARTALGLGSAATQPASAFDAAGAAAAVTLAGLGGITPVAVDAKVASNAFGVPPRVGYIAVPPGFTTSSTGTPTSGTLVWYPMEVIGGYTVDALYAAVTTAQAGGATTFQAAVYKDDGTGWIDGTQQVIAPQTFALSATGNVSGGTLATPVALTAGRYWIAVLYQVTTAPTTTAVFATLFNTTWSLPINVGTNIAGTAVRGYQMTGQTGFPSAAITSGYAPSTASTTPVVGLHRSA